MGFCRILAPILQCFSFPSAEILQECGGHFALVQQPLSSASAKLQFRLPLLFDRRAAEGSEATQRRLYGKKSNPDGHLD